MNSKKIYHFIGISCLVLSFLAAFILQEEAMFAFGIAGIWCAIKEISEKDGEEKIT